ncbi:MAG: TatD family hydrolase [Candidatus Margulisiibacteriota bacterium]
MYIDTHAHLNFPEFKDDYEAVIQRAQEAKVSAIINIALDEEAIQFTLNLSHKYPKYIYSAAGIHPHDALLFDSTIEARLKTLSLEKQIVAIGEMGLDYFYKLAPEEIQKMAFQKQLSLAQEVGLPAIIHSRDATKDTIEVLLKENHGNLKGVLHCFNGDKELTEVALKLGLMFSFTGNITFPKAEVIRKAAKEIPLENIMLETDCPFMAPQVFRGKRNEPVNVAIVADKIAELKGISVEEVARQTTLNARQFFNI